MMKAISRSHLLLTALFAAILMFAFAPSTAHATYADVAEKYSAGQDLPAHGDIVYGEDIPDGTYVVPAVTTSTMCILSHPNTGERNCCVIKVSNGNIVASFSFSKAYNAIFFGTAEEAAASTNDDGSDGSSYIFGDPPSGYVPHLFSITVPALNYPFELATYSGGTKSHDQAAWYSRKVILLSTPEIEDAINNRPHDDSSDDPAPVTPGGNSGSGGSSGGAGPAGGDGGSQGSGGSGSAAQQSASQLRGVELTIASLDDSQSQGSAGAAAAAERGLSPQALIAIVFGVTLLAGIAWRTIGFVRGKRQKVAR
ncbi:MAG: hypothetical protein IKE61_04865 [Coriobacteriales bacterium]|nr:hypothetical protein [Coriobacteriales bacterium]